MATPKPVNIDFETEKIERRPNYPPKPVGVAIGGKYLAWGHPERNNCTKERAQQELRDVYRSGQDLLFQHGKFDVDVAQAHMNLPVPDWRRVHDTLYLIALHDPYAHNFKLKESAERILGIKPEERDTLKQWVLQNVPEARRKPSEWGAYIALAPGDLVGRYAVGDNTRTKKLFQHLWPSINKRGMLAAYDRERHLMPILLRNEQEGIRVDLEMLERDYQMYAAAQEKVDNWLRKRLNAPDLDFNKPVAVAEALHQSGVVTRWSYTKTGRRSTSKNTMTVAMFDDPQVASALGYRNRLKTCLGTFMLPWLEMARRSGGIVYTNWNQVRNSEQGGNDPTGTRTSRLSSNPNFQNVPKNWKKAYAEGYVHPQFLNVPELPLMRRYFLPDPGCVWIRRDYNQQELRILAHFEDGDLLDRYNDDDDLDIHNEVQAGLLEMLGLKLSRDPVKILNFADIYGRGLKELARALGVSIGVAAQVRRAKNKMLPGVAELAQAIVAHVKAGNAIRTWGGREYYPEPPMFSPKYNRWMTFEYKMLNYLIQVSAAECTKESIINYDEHPDRRGRFLLTVHDENDVSAARKLYKSESKVLDEAMQAVSNPEDGPLAQYEAPFDLLMRTDEEVGPNWAFQKDDPNPGKGRNMPFGGGPTVG